MKTIGKLISTTTLLLTLGLNFTQNVQGAATVKPIASFMISPLTVGNSNNMQNLMALLTNPTNFKGIEERNSPTDAVVRGHTFKDGIWMTYVRPGDVISSTAPGFNIWDGTNAPLGVFSGQLGSKYIFPVPIRSTIPFHAWQCTFTNYSSDFYNAFRYAGNVATNTSTGNLVSWSETLIGISWGADGVEGTSDDVIYRSGPCVDLVNVILYVGIRNGFTCTDMNSLSFARNYFGGQYPMGITCTYTLWGGQAHTSSIMASGTAVLSSNPFMTIGRGDDAGVYLTVFGPYDRQYSIHTTTNLIDPIRWAPMTNGVRDHFMITVNTAEPMRYFRARDTGAAPTSGLTAASLEGDDYAFRDHPPLIETSPEN